MGIGEKVPDSGTPSAKSEAEVCLVYLRIKRGQEAGEGKINCYSLELRPAVHNRTHIYSALINELLIATTQKRKEAWKLHDATGKPFPSPFSFYSLYPKSSIHRACVQDE